MNYFTSEVVRNDTGTSREVWQFMLLDGSVILDLRENQERPSKRHKWRMVRDGAWSRLTMGNQYRHLDAPRPTPPDDVVREAVEGIRQKIVYRED